MTLAKPRTGLGRGLGDLIHRTDPELEPQRAEPLAVEPPEGSYYTELPVDSIRPNPKQPRQVFEEDALDELVESIREVGLLQPIVARPLGNDAYELVMGERRLRASQAAGLSTIPAIVRPTAEHDLLRDALLENLHRAQLNPLEEAAAYQQLLTDFDCTQEELSTRIKRSRPHISNTIRLLQLPAPVQRRVAAGVLSAGHARAILGLGDPLAMERLAQRVVAENLSVRAVEEIVALDDGRTPKAPRQRITREPTVRASALAERLVERLDTRVNVVMGTKGRGRIVIEFANDDDLGRLVDLLA
ncbi:MAG: ParB/RepB/Spo0J family partition protein [Micropruina sp.]|uniref:ParB/RepB/Spo0J family partition protein n=1 Tax=Micropruina sp. TaxID=2737536 RepID=UPI0039E48796